MLTEPWKLATGVGVAIVAITSPDVAQAAGSCNVASIQKMAPDSTTITAAEPTAAPVPHCKIDGFVTTRDPGPNQVNFRLQLPDKGWTGRYYFIALGGSAGYVPTDSQIPGGNPLYKGFAVAGTDTGRQGHMLNWSFLSDPVKALDHNHRGVHVVAVATQDITKQYYDVSSIFRYMSGCSGGGRMTVEAITKHPEDFDGVLMGAPGGRGSGSILKFVAATQEMMREPGAWLSPAKLALVEKKVTKVCDATDGALDQMVWDHRKCSFDVATLQCASGADGDECLTLAEVKSFKAILAGPRGPDGKKLAEGMPITNTTSWSNFIGNVPPPWSGEATMENMQKGSAGYVIASTISDAFFGKGYDAATQFDLTDQKDIDAWWAAAKRTGWGLPHSADLRAFKKGGGKLILWNGVSDPCCSDIELEQYYKDVGEKVEGGMPAVESFAKYYSVPGMAHCGGGTGPQDAPDQMLDALVAWVERDKSPGPLITHRGADRVKLAFADPKTKQVSGVVVPPPTGEARDFLLCPFPLVSTFNADMAGTEGAVYQAENWSCTPANAPVAKGR